MFAGFDILSNDAKNAIKFARQEAERLGHDHIGVEHLLLGFCRLDDCVAAISLQAMGLDLVDLQNAVDSRIIRGHLSKFPERIPFTVEFKSLVEHAIEEALYLPHTTVGSEHLLLAMLREEGIATQELKRRDVSLDKARREIKKVLGTEDEQS